MDDGIMGMKNLGKENYWGHLFTLLVFFLLVIVAVDIAIHKIQHPQYTPASPDFFCEQGLMEQVWEDIYPWSDECADLFETKLENMCFTPFGKPVNNSTICIALGRLYREICMEQSCPYSGPGIMVMPDD